MNEHDIDAIFRLTQKRSAEIRSKGEAFNYENTTKQFQAINHNDGTMTAEPSAKLRKFSTISDTKGGRYFVLSTEAQAGRLSVKVAPVNGQLQAHSVTQVGNDPITKLPVYRLNQKYTALPYSVKYNQYRVAPGTLVPGDVVTLHGTMYRVTGQTDTVEGLKQLDLVPYSLPGAQPVKSLKDSYAWNSGATTRNPSTAFKIG